MLRCLKVAIRALRELLCSSQDVPAPFYDSPQARTTQKPATPRGMWIRLKPDVSPQQLHVGRTTISNLQVTLQACFCTVGGSWSSHQHTRRTSHRKTLSKSFTVRQRCQPLLLSPQGSIFLYSQLFDYLLVPQKGTGHDLIIRVSEGGASCVRLFFSFISNKPKHLKAATTAACLEGRGFCFGRTQRTKLASPASLGDQLQILDFHLLFAIIQMFCSLFQDLRFTPSSCKRFFSACQIDHKYQSLFQLHQSSTLTQRKLPKEDPGRVKVL